MSTKFKWVFVISILLSIKTFAQSVNDVSRIVLNSVVIDAGNKMPEDAKQYLETKLTQLASDNGVGGFSINPRFIIAAKINTTSKDIIAGPPQMIAINAEVSFFVGDAKDNKVFASYALAIRGVGTNENKALIEAIKGINIKNSQLSVIIATGKSKIVEFYNSQCEIIQSKAEGLKGQSKYDEAIYTLMQVPDICKMCYEKCFAYAQYIYKLKVDYEGKKLLNEARLKWSDSKNKTGADEAISLLAKINDSAICIKEANKLEKEIEDKLTADEKKEWDYKMSVYNNSLELQKRQIEASKAIAIAYAQNQPATIIYDRIIW